MRQLTRILLGAAACLFGCFGYIYLTLPDVTLLQKTNPPVTSFMELRAEEARAHGLSPRRVQRWVPYGRISGSLKRAVLVAEDDAFWQHDGIDVQQIKESLERDWAKGKLQRGGSTITQQLAKNLYLSPSKDPLRKLRELLIARRLEAALTKTRIFELYLNVIEWGDGIYGAEAASRAYFHKPAAALDADESALLAACIINPRLINPGRETPGLLKRQHLILSRMGIVTPPPDVAAPATDQPGRAPAGESEPSQEGAARPDSTTPVKGGEAQPAKIGNPGRR